MRQPVRWLLAAVGVLLLVAAGGLAATWEPDRPVEQLRARWAPAPSQFMPLLGMQAHVRDVGPREDATPIVLIHGTSASLHTWEPWVRELQTTRRVITMDLPGFGLTGPSPDGDYSSAAYVRYILALLDKLGVQRCVLGGNSLGGQVAWNVAASAPARVERLVLVDAAGYPFQSASVPIGFRIARTPGVRRLMEYTLPRGLIEASVRNVYGDPSRVTPALVDRYFEITLREGNRRAVGERFAQMQPEDTSRIKSLRMPTLILWGGQDRLIPPDNARRFQQDIAGSELVMFDTLGHVPQEEDPVATLAVLKKFLQK